MSVLPDLDASYTDHRRYGVLEAGVNEPTVWIAYHCRASRARRVNEDDHGGRNWTGRRGRRLHMTLAGERARKHSELRMVGACLLP